jgi:hypothetical protein
MPMSHYRQSDERGAFAVVFALMTIMLVTVAALGTDLGNAWSRNTDTQNQADFAAFDTGKKDAAEIAFAASGSPVSGVVAAHVAASMNGNQPQDDAKTCWRTHDCITGTQLTDGDLNNGEARYTSLGLQVITPTDRVDFGFASVFGVSGTSVSGRATVHVYSAGPRIFPMFAVSGCDWGLQALTDPASGDTAVPPLAFNSDNDSQNKLIAGSLVLKDSTGATVSSLVVNSTGNSVLVNATAWKNMTKIGFFRGDDTSPSAVVEQPVFWSAGDAGKTPLAPYTNTSGGQLGLDVPDAIAQAETTWYVRAYNGSSDKWTPRDEALPLAVGRTVLQCDSDPTSGNFGTIKLPRTDVPTAQDLYKNLASGLESPLSLARHLWAVTNNAVPPGTCTDGLNSAVVSTGTGPTPLKAHTNCVDTVTGVTTGDADAGLVTYNGGHGLLTNKPTHDGCAPDHSNASRVVHLSGTNYTINDDTLSCFLLSGKQLIDVQSPLYNLGPAFSDDLLSSPRFGYVPVLKVAPTCGGCQKYSIIDFRPAFITDEQPGSPATSDNGLRVEASGITQMKVFFFNLDAIPRDGDIPLIDFLGVGDPVIHLVD